jgi:hypothetical protein
MVDRGCQHFPEPAHEQKGRQTKKKKKKINNQQKEFSDS